MEDILKTVKNRNGNKQGMWLEQKLTDEQEEQRNGNLVQGDLEDPLHVGMMRSRKQLAKNWLDRKRIGDEQRIQPYKTTCIVAPEELQYAMLGHQREERQDEIIILEKQRVKKTNVITRIINFP